MHILKQVTSEDLKSLQTYWLQRVKNVALNLEREDKRLLDDYNVLKVSIIFKEVDLLLIYKFHIFYKKTCSRSSQLRGLPLNVNILITVDIFIFLELFSNDLPY